jgi:peptidoglycan/LPS O-acetylase OafA/YrhL
MTSIAASPTPTSTALRGRLHWIDWLRVTAIAGVFVFHTLRPFNTDDWHVKNLEMSAVLNGLTTFFTSFGLAVLFLLAGAGVRFALLKRSPGMFIRERTLRLLVPFIVGTLLLAPVQGFIEATHKGTYSGSFLGYLPVWVADVGGALGGGPSPTVFGVGYHLWFLGFLFAISIIALPLCDWLMGDRGRRLIGLLVHGLGWLGATLTFVVPLFVLMGIGAALGTSEHDWFEFAWYFGYFMIGFILFSDERFTAAVRRDLWPAAGVALVATALIAAAIPAPLDTAGQHGMGPIDLALGALFATLGWSWTLIILNIGMRVGRLQEPVSEHIGDAILPVYVIHQPVILAVAFFVVAWPLGILAKWLVVFGVSALVTLVLVELALRTPIARLLLGARVRPHAADGAPPMPVVLVLPSDVSPPSAAHHAPPP